jgi:hypothetical protein
MFDTVENFSGEERVPTTKKLRESVASTYLPKRFSDSTHQFSGIAKGKGSRFQANYVGIYPGSSKPSEILTSRVGPSYQTEKFEDDNVRFLATGTRLRRNDGVGRDLELATQRINRLNVYPDGTPREGIVGDLELEKLQRAQFNDAITNLPSSIAALIPAAQPAPLPAAIVPPASLDAAAKARLRAAVEAKFDELLKQNKADIENTIAAAKDESKALLEANAAAGIASPELLSIQDKIAKFDEAKFDKNFPKFDDSRNMAGIGDRKLLSGTNLEALRAVAALMTGHEASSTYHNPITPQGLSPADSRRSSVGSIAPATGPIFSPPVTPTPVVPITPTSASSGGASSGLGSGPATPVGSSVPIVPTVFTPSGMGAPAASSIPLKAGAKPYTAVQYSDLIDKFTTHMAFGGRGLTSVKNTLIKAIEDGRISEDIVNLATAKAIDTSNVVPITTSLQAEYNRIKGPAFEAAKEGLKNSLIAMSSAGLSSLSPDARTEARNFLYEASQLDPDISIPALNGAKINSLNDTEFYAEADKILGKLPGSPTTARNDTEFKEASDSLTKLTNIVTGGLVSEMTAIQKEEARKLLYTAYKNNPDLARDSYTKTEINAMDDNTLQDIIDELTVPSTPLSPSSTIGQVKVKFEDDKASGKLYSDTELNDIIKNVQAAKITGKNRSDENTKNKWVAYGYYSIMLKSDLVPTKIQIEEVEKLITGMQAVKGKGKKDTNYKSAIDNYINTEVAPSSVFASALALKPKPPKPPSPTGSSGATPTIGKSTISSVPLSKSSGGT